MTILFNGQRSDELDHCINATVCTSVVINELFADDVRFHSPRCVGFAMLQFVTCRLVTWTVRTSDLARMAIFYAFNLWRILIVCPRQNKECRLAEHSHIQSIVEKAIAVILPCHPTRRALVHHWYVVVPMLRWKPRKKRMSTLKAEFEMLPRLNINALRWWNKQWIDIRCEVSLNRPERVPLFVISEVAPG